MSKIPGPLKQTFYDFQLGKSEHTKFMELLMESSAAGMAILDNEMRYLYANTKWLSNLKIGDNNITGKLHYEVFSDISEEWKEVYQRCLKGSEFKSERKLFYCADGASKWFKWEIKTWQKTANEIGGLILISEVLAEQNELKNNTEFGNQKYKIILENISDSVILLDQNYQVQYHSLIQLNVVETNTLSYINQSIIDFLHPNDIFEFTTLLNQSIASPNVSIVFNVRILAHDGNYRWIEGSIKNLLGDEYVGSLLINYRDISSRKLAEQELIIAKLKAERNAKQLAVASSEIKDQELKYRTLFESSSDSFLLLFEGSWIDCNTSATKLFGCTRAEIINSSPDRFSPTYQPDGNLSENEAKERISMAYLGEPQSFEWLHCKADGTTFNAEVSLNKIDLFGRPHIQAIIRDVTEKKKAQEQLALSDLIVSSTDDAIVSQTADGYINSWNPSAERIFGYSAVEAIGKHGSFILSGELMQNEEVLFKQVLAGDSFNLFETTRLRKDGKIIFVSLSISPIFNQYGKVIGVSKIYRDISDKKLLEKEKAKVISDLIQRNRDLEQFSFIVSHNLRSPVTNVMGVCDLLQSEKLESDLSKDLINGLSKSATALDTVIRDLNYILQVKREVNELHAELFFSEIVDQIKLSISNLIIQENASIITDFSEINKFSTIKTYLYSIFYNLILNSLKYKKPHVDPIIEIKSSLQADSFTLFFKDNGLGIDLEKKGDQLFMLYKRFHFHKEGKGMGLFMVKSQVETLGGKIFVSSEVGKGTEFRIVFDLKNHH